jgi:hypothetical protein
MELAYADPDGRLAPVDPLPAAARQAFARLGAPGTEAEQPSSPPARGGYSLIAEAREAGEHLLTLLVAWPDGGRQGLLPKEALDWLLEPPGEDGFRRLTMHETHLRALGITGSYRGDGELSILGVVENDGGGWMVALLKTTRSSGL